MNEVGVADRARLLRSKQLELSRIVTSRRRKLREVFAVCDHDGPLPHTNLQNPDAPPTSLAEERFLEVTDILKDRLFDESNLPTRRQLRSDTSKQKNASRKGSPDGKPGDKVRKISKGQRDGSKSRKSRAPTPTNKSDAGTATATPTTDLGAESNVEPGTVQGMLMQRSTSKGSQIDLPAEGIAVRKEIVEEPFGTAAEAQPLAYDGTLPASALESDRIRSRLESQPNSPGVDPRKAMPISAVDTANLPGELHEGLGLLDENHKATTAHLPPREVQEQRIRDANEAREHRKDRNEGLSITLPQESVRNTDALSSPGSTIDANSAATPAMHEASTDTSPENDSRYDPERMENKVDDAATPPEMRPRPEECAEREEHDRILQAQIDVSTAEIMKDNVVDSQSPHEQTAFGLQGGDSQTSVENITGSIAGKLTQEASEVVQDIVEDGTEVIGVQSDDKPTDSISEAKPKEQEANPVEVPDSEAEEDTSPAADAMDLDATTIKDSFESAAPASENTPVPANNIAIPSPRQGNETDASTTPVATPRRIPPTPAPVLERMTTRVASGAMRHKSVSEILGETPRPESHVNSHSPSRSATPQSPGARVRSLVEKAREKERSKLSTVVFPGRPPKSAAAKKTLVASGSPAMAVKDDYFMPLFLSKASADKTRPLDAILQSAHKTITTSNAYIPVSENQTTQVLKRIYSLQNAGKWMLRQPKRSAEPIRQTTHWDLLLQEAKWMRTDFREERKWRSTVASNMAHACAEWVNSSTEDRKILQVKATPPPIIDPSRDTEMADGSSQAGTHPTPDLVASAEFDSPMEDFDEEPRLNLLETVAPTAIFALQDDDVVFGLRRSPTSDKLLAELPMYGAPLRVPEMVLATSDIDPDRFWKRAALPLSKFVEGRLELKTTSHPRKKSRYEYELEDDDDEPVVFGEPQTKRPILAPEKTDVALFNPEHKHIRDRIHSSHQFRPPSEFQMPLQTFFECRIPSQWTWDEDNELKGYVRDYSYNWSLISSLLGSKSLYVSGAERRTPWECFERWIHLEGLPADMQKTHYFRAYTARIDAANRIVTAQNNAAPPQANANGQVQPAPRRRPTTSVRVERRRNQKHLTLVDAMRKLAKKRETNHHKQAHAQGMAAMRKANEVPNANRNLLGTTPQDFSKLKHEREEAFRERVVQMQQRQEVARRLQQQQQQQQQPGRNPVNPQQPNMVNGVPRPANAAMPMNGLAPPSGQNLAVPGQNRPRPMPPQMPGQSMPNSLRVPQMPMNGIPTAQMQGQMPLPNPVLDVGLVSRAQQISQHQQAIRLQQQSQMPGQSPQMHNSPPRLNGVPQPGFQMQTNMMPPFNPNGNGVSTPPVNHVPSPGQGHASSPRIGPNPLQPPPNPGASSHISMLEHQFKQKYPGASNEQIASMIQAQLSKTILGPNQQQHQHQQQQHQQRQGFAQSAMNAAAGANLSAAGMNAGMTAGMSNAAQGTPQLYAQMLRQQQENQQKAAQQAQQAAASVNVGNGNGQSPPMSNTTANMHGNANANGNTNTNGNGGNSAQGHAHRASSGSAGVQSGGGK
ncbi:related to chromatin modification-related protein vid21 [Rhynchosporium graminicola]|uniref:Vacuolar import and degradation protein 21 n=1 Tax=Rhynchosporium graminicola TaxID=2792576 RepID=A0A1E1LCB3_9HELO|nr:related to chromatin modification-related protein vid21 [Rhynchosporium commune]